MKKIIVFMMLVTAMCIFLTSCRQPPALTRAADQYSDLYDVYGEDLGSMSNEEIIAILEEIENDETADILH